MCQTFATCYSTVTFLTLYRQEWHMSLLFFYSLFSLLSLHLFFSLHSHRFPLSYLYSSQSLSPSKVATVDLAQLPSISLSHARSRRSHSWSHFSNHDRSHPEAAIDLTLFPLLSVRLSLCLSLVVGFFFWLQFGLI